MAKQKIKALKIIKIALLLVVLVAVLITGIDYAYYKLGNRSFIFGTLDVFRQDQTLRSGNLDLKVNSVILKVYEPIAPVQTDCSGLSKVRLLGGRLIFFGSPYDVCQSLITNYQEKVAHSKIKNELAVEFEYSNISDQPINLSDYSVKLIANTPLETYDSPVTKCTGMSKSVFLNGYTEKECLSVDIDKGYNGSLVLSVTRGGKEKIVNLTIPETALLK